MATRKPRTYVRGFRAARRGPRHVSSPAPTGRQDPTDKNWTMLLAAKDAGRGRRRQEIQPGRPAKRVADADRERHFAGDSGLVSVRRLAVSRRAEPGQRDAEVRDREAHHESRSLPMTLTGHWTPQNGCCGPSGHPESADEVKRSRIDLRRVSSSRRTAAWSRSQGATEVGFGWASPWREVLRPHDDVAKGNFRAAEFAADLAMVARGEATGGTDPVEFFRHLPHRGSARSDYPRGQTALRDMNASPVINLQTNFGGGKTHSMLACGIWLPTGRSPSTHRDRGPAGSSQARPAHRAGRSSR